MNTIDSRIDRARGTVIGSATGDALGAGYEFTKPNFSNSEPAMIGGGLGPFAPGEWTDDTSMLFAILEVAALEHRLHTPEQLTQVARNFRHWYETRPPDIGIQTSRVLAAAGMDPTGESMTAAAAEVTERLSRASGNGSLMRTAPVGLPYLDDPATAAEAAKAISALTHPDERAQEACVLWTLAIVHAINEGEFDLRSQIDYLPAASRMFWVVTINDAELNAPATFTPNGYVVAALQAAWSAITATADAKDGTTHFRNAMRVAIGIGHDTDTVAAIAGALLGARWGAAAIPREWTEMLHGYPEMTGDDIAELAELASKSSSHR